MQKEAQHSFSKRENDWGFSELIKVKDVESEGAGFLDAAGTLRIKVDIQILRGPEWPGYDPRKETGCVGINNQGATCYLNSLLQTLYHLPAFRKAVYQIPTGEEETPTDSIPVALQHLFFRLQYADDAVDTKELTKAFGWDTYEAFQQHDVQELARVLMDTLDQKMKNTPVEKDIVHLMEGSIMNTIKCKNVDFRSDRKEAFQDLQLVVKGCKDLYSSFDEYIASEVLDGDNKYDAEKYGHQDAVKFTKLEATPPVLFLHLRRFEFDLHTLQQVKINDRFEFPSALDLDRESRKFFSETSDTSVR